mmetsp:Transcript_3761/g.2230  ORF Transcript_3761/g.2230 Transcript_3761/m.2230 type:complete len:470 (+) Transcript_3761:1105-2514(+)
MKPIPWTTKDILEATSGSLLSGKLNIVFPTIGIDSKKISAKELFIAIEGEKHDGHKFINDLIGTGARGFLINKDRAQQIISILPNEDNFVCIGVPDTVKALGDLAAFQRNRADISVVAITGSNGKTTARIMSSSVIEKRFNTLSTYGNFNNEIGLPLTLLNICPEHRWAVVELGMNHPGEIARLAEISSPDIGVILNICYAHIEGVGSIDGVMMAKGEILGEIKASGIAVLNADDQRIMKLAKKETSSVLFFGMSDKAQIRAYNIEKRNMKISFELITPSGNVSINLPVRGDFMVYNALAAAAIGFCAGLSCEKIKAGLESFIPAKGRLNIIRTSKNVNIIDDTYNANPESMKAAIKELKALSGSFKKNIVIGDMLELGEFSEKSHYDIGRLVGDSGISELFVTGDFSRDIKKGAESVGLSSENIFLGTKEEITDKLNSIIKPEDWVLVKGSRMMAMEEVVRRLTKTNS